MTSGWVNIVHQPVVATDFAGRNEVTSRPIVGSVHSAVIKMIKNDDTGLLNERRTALTAGSVRCPGLATDGSAASTLIACHAPFATE